MRIGVLGAAGQLGSDLCPRLPGEVVPLSRAEIDLTRHELIPELLHALRLDVLVNCAPTTSSIEPRGNLKPPLR